MKKYKVGQHIKTKDGTKGIIENIYPDTMLIRLFPSGSYYGTRYNYTVNGLFYRYDFKEPHFYDLKTYKVKYKLPNWW